MTGLTEEQLLFLIKMVLYYDEPVNMRWSAFYWHGKFRIRLDLLGSRLHAEQTIYISPLVGRMEIVDTVKTAMRKAKQDLRWQLEDSAEPDHIVEASDDS